MKSKQIINLIFHRYAIIVTIAIVVTSYISFFLVAINAGFSEDFWFIWLRSWAIAFLLAVPSLLFVAPAIRNWFHSSFFHASTSK